MSGAREIELKLECDGPDLTALSAHPLLQAEAETEPLLLSATYFDTPARDLRAAGLSLRVRREGERILQTVKGASASTGLFDRPEWEREIAGNAPDPAAYADTPVAAVLAKADDATLAPLFVTAIERTARTVPYGAATIAMTLDLGRIESELGDAPVCELELELKQGQPADLFALAQALAETVPLRLGVLSKGERGDALIGERLHKPSKAGTTPLDPEGTAGEAFVQIAHGCLRHLRLNEDVFLFNRDPEALHQIRVAVRRLRSAFTLFKPMLKEDAAAERLRGEIKRVTAPFGEARNLDVFLSETLPAEIERRPHEPGLPELREKLLPKRAASYDAVLAVLGSPEWRALLIDLVTWLEAGTWHKAEGLPERDRPAVDFAADVLQRLRRRVRKRGKHLADLEPEARHRLRIEAKKLRYGAEFFAPLFSDKKARRRHKAFVVALSDMQDQLGALNDLATAHAIARMLTPQEPGAETPGPALFAAGLTAADNEAHAGDLIEKAETGFDALVDVKPFWS
ncbi:CYTH and CHAD domain-containing protein [Methylobacterium organophilum]|uniref:Inorganic triphosphatase YgiF, contains CYTH and CHAD domains n=1 Tax=Methylobacterium organophilum TaxID=410 RepID=A0ABQ4TE94_METOR|nr:CYTH and CHAD domain-containing protein [Methylobacterium organophilum]GJE29240.1 hypothetical protein LKMONMHP_4119 [Methylobacterium organophilum]